MVSLGLPYLAAGLQGFPRWCYLLRPTSVYTRSGPTDRSRCPRDKALNTKGKGTFSEFAFGCPVCSGPPWNAYFNRLDLVSIQDAQRNYAKQAIKLYSRCPGQAKSAAHPAVVQRLPFYPSTLIRFPIPHISLSRRRLATSQPGAHVNITHLEEMKGAAQL